MKNRIYTCLLLLLFQASCGGGHQQAPDETTNAIPPVAIPPFSPDSSYAFVKKQIDFGPRIPNTVAHHKAGDYFIAKLASYGAQVTVQAFKATSFDGEQLELRNIIGSFMPERTKRILLAAHWDTRPFADRDKQAPQATFDGANDGASGVGVLLELARLLGQKPPPHVGVDIVLFDGEDYGERSDAPFADRPPAPYESWYCLGSQYWSLHKHKPNYSAYYGIVLDMVGAQHAQFHREGYSMEYAPRIVDKVWSTAQKLGYSHVFINKEEGGIIDDHKFVNEMAKIPTIDIVHFDPGIGYFGEFWHTRGDNLELISAETLGAVGQTIAAVVYFE